MAVRNFWIEANIDGRETMLAGGPKNKSGGMYVNIYQRDDGGIVHAVSIICQEDGKGNLVTKIYDNINQSHAENDINITTRR